MYSVQVVPDSTPASQYFRWVMHMKAKLQVSSCNTKVMNNLFPTYTNTFQRQLLSLVFQDYSASFMRMVLGKNYAWVVSRYQREHDVLLKTLQNNGKLLELLIRSWEKRVGIQFHYR